MPVCGDGPCAAVPIWEDLWTVRGLCNSESHCTPTTGLQRSIPSGIRVYAMDYSNMGSLGICGKVLHLFAKFTFLSSQL